MKRKIKFTKKEKLKKENNLKTSGNGIDFQSFKKILEYNDSEKNELSYEKALKYDKRTFLRYYYSLLKIYFNPFVWIKIFPTSNIIILSYKS